MDTFDAISKRRSIRKFINKEIPKEMIEKILNAALQAPSAKNLQPWRFVVVSNTDKTAMLREIRRGIENTKELMKDFPDIDNLSASANYSVGVMEQAPVTVFVFNTIDDRPWLEKSVELKSSSCANAQTIGDAIENMLFTAANIQSIGAAIENMLLAATSMGIGSLWICDIIFAYKEICQWLGEECRLAAAVSFGYANEAPDAKPRNTINDAVQWR